MSQLVSYQPLTPALHNFSREQVDLIKQTVAKGATDTELKFFLTLASKYGLDPFRKEIWFVKRGGDATIMTSRDGYLKIAMQDPNFDGLQSMVVKEGDEFEYDAENCKVRHKFGTKRGGILGAWAIARHKKRPPVICFVDFNEYKGESPVWKKYPSAMIQKVAEVFVLRRQFNISGLVTGEELDHADVVDMQPVVDVMEETAICSDCGQAIAPTGKYNAKQIAEISQQKFGRRLCVNCGKKEKEKAEAETPTETIDQTQPTDDYITDAQMKKIWALAKQNQLEKTDIDFTVFETFGKQSIKALTKAEASQLIEHLNSLPAKNPELKQLEKTTENFQKARGVV